MESAMAVILLIEDHHDIAAMVCEHLEYSGYEVDYAADGITGLHLAVTGEFDAIILDLEDALAPEHKDAARADLARALADDPGGAPLWVRVNAADSPWFEDDPSADMAVVE